MFGKVDTLTGGVILPDHGVAIPQASSCPSSYHSWTIVFLRGFRALVWCFACDGKAGVLGVQAVPSSKPTVSWT